MSGGRPWTSEEDAALRELVTVGVEYRKIARRLKRSVVACRCRASFFGLKMTRAAILENRRRGRDRFYNNPKKTERRVERLLKSYTPFDRKIRAEELRQRNKAGITGLKGRHHRPDVCARISASNKGKVRTPEQRQRYSEGAKRRWKEWHANRPEARAKAAMLADKAALRFSVWVGDSAVPPETPHVWCSQCERQVTAARADECSSPFCKAKAEAA